MLLAIQGQAGQSLAALGAFEQDLVNVALECTTHQVRYDGCYLALSYPNGDVPAHIDVCSDVVIRSYRYLGIDLQQLEDMLFRY